MLDSVSLDQLRTFIAAVDAGSFSAASRKLLRSQSVVSEAISNLEDQIGVKLFDRSGHYPKLTAAGSVILADARGIITGVDAHGNPIMISGNNGNRVREAPISRGRIYAYVMPTS